MIPYWLQEQLHTKQDLTFFEFMQQALYHPHHGYYNNHSHKFGLHGDFITAPELTPLFGNSLAKQCQQILSIIKNPTILEFGAGSGKLCLDIMTQLEILQCLPEQYLIMEVSGSLRTSQQQLLQTQLPHLYQRIQWLNTLPTQQFSGIILANEVLDAIPVHKFLYKNNNVYESHIQLTTEQKLIECYLPTNNHNLQTYVKNYVKQQPYQSEINFLLPAWLNTCNDILSNGALLILDYGFPRHEYYHPDRQQGTLMCHYQHKTHINPLINIGAQDITAHVDFTHVAESATAAGFKLAGYTNQAAFLLNCGILNLLATNNTSINNHQAIKQLLQPQEMGELFKVIALTKNLNLDLSGFSTYDKRMTLYAKTTYD